MLISVHWLVFEVICFNPKKVCGAPAGSNKAILVASEKCQSSVQDPRLYYLEQSCTNYKLHRKSTPVAVVLMYELEAGALAAD